MVTSILLAKFIALAFIPVGLILLCNRTLFHKVIATLAENITLFIISGFISLIVGSFIIAAHNDWVANWTVVITIVGWFLFISGIIRLCFPHKLLQILQSSKIHIIILIMAIVMLLVGLFLLYHGYYLGH